MITLPTKAPNEEPQEVTVSLAEMKFVKLLPACPKCKLTDDVFFFNVTKKIFECTRCNLRYHFA